MSQNRSEYAALRRDDMFDKILEEIEKVTRQYLDARRNEVKTETAKHKLNYTYVGSLPYKTINRLREEIRRIQTQYPVNQNSTIREQQAAYAIRITVQAIDKIETKILPKIDHQQKPSVKETLKIAKNLVQIVRSFDMNAPLKKLYGEVQAFDEEPMYIAFEDAWDQLMLELCSELPDSLQEIVPFLNLAWYESILNNKLVKSVLKWPPKICTADAIQEIYQSSVPLIRDLAGNYLESLDQEPEPEPDEVIVIQEEKEDTAAPNDAVNPSAESLVLEVKAVPEPEPVPELEPELVPEPVAVQPPDIIEVKILSLQNRMNEKQALAERAFVDKNQLQKELASKQRELGFCIKRLRAFPLRISQELIHADDADIEQKELLSAKGQERLLVLTAQQEAELKIILDKINADPADPKAWFKWMRARQYEVEKFRELLTMLAVPQKDQTDLALAYDFHRKTGAIRTKPSHLRYSKQEIIALLKSKITEKLTELQGIRVSCQEDHSTWQQLKTAISAIELPLASCEAAEASAKLDIEICKNVQILLNGIQRVKDSLDREVQQGVLNHNSCYQRLIDFDKIINKIRNDIYLPYTSWLLLDHRINLDWIHNACIDLRTQLNKMHRVYLSNLASQLEQFENEMPAVLPPKNTTEQEANEHKIHVIKNLLNNTQLIQWLRLLDGTNLKPVGLDTRLECLINNLPIYEDKNSLIIPQYSTATTPEMQDNVEEFIIHQPASILPDQTSLPQVTETAPVIIYGDETASLPINDNDESKVPEPAVIANANVHDAHDVDDVHDVHHAGSTPPNGQKHFSYHFLLTVMAKPKARNVALVLLVAGVIGLAIGSLGLANVGLAGIGLTVLAAQIVTGVSAGCFAIGAIGLFANGKQAAKLHLQPIAPTAPTVNNG